MGFRFRKNVKLFPGVRLNLGKKGASLSVGPRGVSVNFGKNGVRTTVGLPGAGLSYTQNLASGRNRVSRAPAPDYCGERETLGSVSGVTALALAGFLGYGWIKIAAHHINTLLLLVLGAVYLVVAYRLFYGIMRASGKYGAFVALLMALPCLWLAFYAYGYRG